MIPSGQSAWTLSSALASAMSSASVLVGLLMVPPARSLAQVAVSARACREDGGACARLSSRVDPLQSDDRRQRAGRERVGLRRFRRQLGARGGIREARLHLA